MVSSGYVCVVHPSSPRNSHENKVQPALTMTCCAALDTGYPRGECQVYDGRNASSRVPLPERAWSMDEVRIGRFWCLQHRHNVDQFSRRSPAVVPWIAGRSLPVADEATQGQLDPLMSQYSVIILDEVRNADQVAMFRSSSMFQFSLFRCH